jgi:predicted nucleotidyltransferase
VSTGLEQLLRILHAAGVKFVLIGGLAAIAHGAETVTGDVDICYARDRDNLERLSQALAPFHPRLRGVPRDLPFRLDLPTLRTGLNFTLTTDLADLDLLGEVLGLGEYDAVSAASEELQLYGLPCSVISLEALIRAKRAAGRPKDLRALQELEALFVLAHEKEEEEAK